MTQEAPDRPVPDRDDIAQQPVPPRPHYTLSELLANSDYSQPLSSDDRAWLDAKPVGRELV